MTAGDPASGPGADPRPEQEEPEQEEQVFCEACGRSYPYDALGEEGECPGCGTLLLRPRRVPWNFRIIAAGTAVYLLWRLGQGLDWLARYIGRHL